MKDFSVAMALFDFVPVVLYLIAAIRLQRAFYGRMGRGLYTLFAAGTIDVTAAGALKALYKLLYALGVCDFEALSSIFMPLQAIGFLLAGLAMILFVCRKKRDTLLFAAPPLFGGTMVFVVMMVLGLAGVNISLAILSARSKKRGAAVLFLISLVCCMAMGYLSSRDFTAASMNWLAEGINVLGQGCLLLGTGKLTR